MDSELTTKKIYPLLHVIFSLSTDKEVFFFLVKCPVLLSTRFSISPSLEIFKTRLDKVLYSLL